jgi:hypothetical protein
LAWVGREILDFEQAVVSWLLKRFLKPGLK